MQNKAAIQIFTILLAVVCIYHLSFTWVVNSVENDAKAFANGDSQIESDYLDSMKSVAVYPIFDHTYAKCKTSEINLGLDLKGGMNVTLEVSVVDILKALANKSQDETFQKALVTATKLQEIRGDDYIVLFKEAFEQIDPQAKLASPSIFGTREMQGRIKYESTNDEVIAVLQREVDAAIIRSFLVLRTRIDKFGVSQPNIQRLGTSGRIQIELPGVKDPERVRKLLQGTAKLEFWETHTNQEIYPFLAKANDELARYGKAETIKETGADSLQTGSETESNGNDEETVEAKSDSTAVDSSEKSLLDQIASGDGGTDEDATLSDADREKNNPLFYKLSANVGQDEQGQKVLVRGPAVGICLIKDTAAVNEMLRMPRIKAIFPATAKFLWAVKPFDDKGKALRLYAMKVVDREGNAPLGGDVIKSASGQYDQLSSQAEVRMVMSPEGTKIWKRLTRDNKGKSIAIVLDNHVYSAPNVINEIPNGISSITGDFSKNEADDLANILEAGKLPAPTKVVEEAIVGPSLGEKAINDGVSSFGIALIIVLLYMIFYYGKAGIASNVALFANIFFLMGVLSSVTAVLTLAGIAGIVLTIGMSVDANVLIYERIREELAAGKGLHLAISDGYKKAYSSIIDANVTTFLTGAILFIFGSGPIQGFAFTLMVGIGTSMFSAIFITRMIFTWMLDRNKEITFSTRMTEGAFKNIKFSFIGKRKLYYMISGVVIIAGLASMLGRAEPFDLGVDFSGGRSYVIEFKNDVASDEVSKVLTADLMSAPSVKTFGSDKVMKITTKYLINDVSEDVEKTVLTKVYNGLSPIIGSDVSFETFKSDYLQSSQKVGPTIADDIKVKAVWSIVFSLVIIFLYIYGRFGFKWQLGMGALVAIFHDVLVVMSCFSLLHGIMPFTMEIDQAFIAAILTVVGYSINDTVVVFDRIREYLELHKKKGLSDLIDNALNDTLSRTFNTSITIFVVLLAIFLFGGEVIKGFSFALLIGVVVGTYSSLCIATPIYYELSKKNS
ncbi:MAG: protein translocase subunit SecDF [Flavobacteriales bacterium]|nr:protein translocase subunit SecDF [Flavobacteriales bacterium]